MSKLSRLWREETQGWNSRLFVANLLTRALPPFVGGRVRVALLRWAGVTIGRGTVLADTPSILGGGRAQRRLRIGKACWFNVGCTLDASAFITIGDRVRLGQQVLVLTHTHELGNGAQRAGTLRAQPVQIGDGAWLGARCTILPGVTVHAGAVVAAGAVVTKSVPAHTLVGGVPARPLRSLAEDARPEEDASPAKWGANGVYGE